MPKVKISEYSQTAASNTDINSININEGCPPSTINNAIRELMSQIKDFQIGSEGDGLTVGGSLVVVGTSTFGAIQGTFADGSAAAPSITNTGDTNTGVFFPADNVVGISTDGTEKVRVDSSGNVGIGTSSPAAKLEVAGNLSVADGTVSAPSITNNGDTDTGVYFPAANEVAIAVGGVQRFRVAGTTSDTTNGTMLHQGDGYDAPNIYTYAYVQNNAVLSADSTYYETGGEITVTNVVSGGDDGSGSWLGGFYGDTTSRRSGNPQIYLWGIEGGWGTSVAATTANTESSYINLWCIRKGSGTRSFRWDGGQDVDNGSPFSAAYAATTTNPIGPAHFCRAWVNFNGTGTVAIRASGNVSSITDNGTGDYTVNFTAAMPDADYGVNVTGQRNENNNNQVFGQIKQSTSSSLGTGSVRIAFLATANDLQDPLVCCASIFR